MIKLLEYYPQQLDSRHYLLPGLRTLAGVGADFCYAMLALFAFFQRLPTASLRCFCFLSTTRHARTLGKGTGLTAALIIQS
jgi:hypothetical protein